VSRPVGLQLRTCVSTSAARRRSLAGSALDRTRYAWSPTVSAIGADGMDARSLTLWVNDGNGVFGRWLAGSALRPDVGYCGVGWGAARGFGESLTGIWVWRGLYGLGSVKVVGEGCGCGAVVLGVCVG